MLLKLLQYNFLNGKYYGVSTVNTDGEINDAFIKGLTKQLTTGRTGSFTVNATAGQYIYFAIPSSFGVPVFNVGGFDGGFNKIKTFNFTNASGHAENYDVYKIYKCWTRLYNSGGEIICLLPLLIKLNKSLAIFKLLDAVDIDWTGFKIPATNITLPDNVATDAEVDSKLQNRPTTDQMNSAIQQAIGKVDHLRRVVLDKGASLPDSSQDKNTIYMKPESDGSYSEWFWVVGSDGRGKWEEIGSSKVDLSSYLTKQKLAILMLKD